MKLFGVELSPKKIRRQYQEELEAQEDALFDELDDVHRQLDSSRKLVARLTVEAAMEKLAGRVVPSQSDEVSSYALDSEGVLRGAEKNYHRKLVSAETRLDDAMERHDYLLMCYGRLLDEVNGA